MINVMKEINHVNIAVWL